MNEIQIIGNLTRDPSLRTVDGANGPTNVCSFSVAVNTRRKDASGNNIAVFYNVNAWRGLADVCQKYLAKGRKVYVSGEPSARTYQAQDGSTRVSIDIRAEDVEFLSSGQNSNQSNGTDVYSAPAPEMSDPSGYTPVSTDELPF